MNKPVKTIVATAKELIEKARDPGFAIAMIEQLQGGMTHRLPIERLIELIDALLRDIPYLGYPQRNLRLLRGRIDSRITLDRQNEFSFLPVEKSHSYGRCHRPGKSVFYGASNLDTVLSELLPEVGDKVHVGTIRLKPEAEIILTAIGEIDYVRRYDRAWAGNERSTQLIKDTIKSYGETQKLRALLIDAFFSEQFSRPAAKQRDYKITSALSELLLEGQTSEQKYVQDGFAYPSVAHRGGINFAIRPSSITEHFEWEQFDAYEVTELFGFGLYRIRKYATSTKTEADGQISWSMIA
jgi:hypothetical protein